MRQKIHRTNPLPVLGLFGVVTLIVIFILIFSPYSWNKDSLILLIGIILLDNIVYFGLVKGTYIILENSTLTSVSWLFVKVKMDILNIKKILLGMWGASATPILYIGGSDKLGELNIELNSAWYGFKQLGLIMDELLMKNPMIECESTKEIVDNLINDEEKYKRHSLVQ